MMTKNNENEIMVSEEPIKVRRPYHRRSKEEIEAEKAEKEAKRAARAAAKAAKEAAKEAKAEAKSKTEDSIKETSKKKGAGQKAIEPSVKGAWSNPNKSLDMHKMYIELELLESALGTSPSNKELLTTYIASRAPDAASKAEEIAALGEEEMELKGTTIFPKGYFALTENGEHFVDVLDRKDGGNCKPDPETNIRLPFFWNYQIRGFFKDSCGLLSKGKYGESAELSAYKKVIDGNIFVTPRRIAMDLPDVYVDDFGEIQELDPENLPILQRPLRISGPSGERTAIASSELIPAGTRIKFCINYTNAKMRSVIIEWLNYGSEHGLGAWRNSGRGSFRWRELNEDYSPIIDEE